MNRIGKSVFFFACAVLAMAMASGAVAGTPEPDRSWTTPLERKNYAELTRHGELVDFLRDLSGRSDRLTLGTLGESVEGRPIPYLKISSGRFGEDRESKLMLLIFAQQHGNEPSGKEASLALARDFARGRYDDCLESLDILLVPQVNPDGSERHQRRNAENVDLNRSHLILNGREVRHLRELFHRWEPEVTLDVHEYQPWVNSWLRHGFVRRFDEQYGLPTNLNVPASIRDLGESEFLPFAGDHLQKRGFSFHNYTVGNPDSIRYSTTNINDGRQGFAILGTFGLILEGKAGRSPTDDIERRTLAQTVAMEALLQFCAVNSDSIRRRVRAARADLENGSTGRFVLSMTRESDGTPLAILARAVEPAPEGSEERYVKTSLIDATIDNYFPLVASEAETALPEAYLIPASEEGAIRLLELHRVELKKLKKETVFQVEEWVFEKASKAEASVAVEGPSASRYAASPGDVLVPTAQLRRLLIATALEPRSMHGLIDYPGFEHWKKEGIFPIRRVRQLDPSKPRLRFHGSELADPD